MMNLLNGSLSLQRKKMGAIALAVAAFAMAAPAVAQQKPGPLTLTAHALNDGVYWVDGGVSNTGFIVGDKGVIVIDAQRNLEGGQKALVEIGKITAKPVNAVVLTHGDPDHVGGLPAYPAGSAIFAQENTRSQILVAAADANNGPMFGGMYRTLLDFLPTRTIGATETVLVDGVKMVLMHIAPAHSSGDLIVYLPSQKIVFAGDIITTNTGRYPIIHYDTGGTSLGWIESMKAMLALDVDTYVSGHGAIESKAMLRARLDLVEVRRDQIRTMVNDNKSLAQVKLALPEEASAMPFDSFVETTYLELSKGYPAAAVPWSNMRAKK